MKNLTGGYYEDHAQRDNISYHRYLAISVWSRVSRHSRVRKYLQGIRKSVRSVRNRSQSRAFVCQSVIPALMADASTPSCHLNLGLPRLLCPCGRPKKTLWGGSSVSMRTTWPAHRSLAILIRCTTVRSPYISYNKEDIVLLKCLKTAACDICKLLWLYQAIFYPT